MVVKRFAYDFVVQICNYMLVLFRVFLLSSLTFTSGPGGFVFFMLCP